MNAPSLSTNLPSLAEAVETPPVPTPTPRDPPERGQGGPPRAASLASRLIEVTHDSTWAHEAQRLAGALSLSAAFGLALGLRHGGLLLAWGAAGAPLGIVAVSALAAPALAILLALADAPVDALALARATSRGAAKAGLLLCGLAPAVALFVVTVEDAITVTAVGFGTLLLAGAIAARSFHDDLAPVMAAAPPGRRNLVRVAVWAFLAFAGALALRVWCLALPMLTVVS